MLFQYIACSLHIDGGWRGNSLVVMWDHDRLHDRGLERGCDRMATTLESTSAEESIVVDQALQGSISVLGACK